VDGPILEGIAPTDGWPDDMESTDAPSHFIILVVIGLASTIFGAAGFASPHYGQPGTVVCHGHPMGRDEICHYSLSGKGTTKYYVENYDQKLAHQTKTAKTAPQRFLFFGLPLLLVGGLGLLPLFRRRRGSPG
jgi:hypothetical protein